MKEKGRNEMCFLNDRIFLFVFWTEREAIWAEPILATNIGNVRLMYPVSYFPGLLVEGQNEGSNKRKDYKTAVLDRRAQFDCSVKSTGSAENAAQVEIWWQFQDKNVTSHAISVTKEAG